MTTTSRLSVLLLLATYACAGTPGAAPPLVTAHAGGVLFTGAGDIGRCDGLGDDSTAALLDRIPGLIWTTGDNAYPAGSVGDFAACYGPSWGRHKERTRPTPGNHEYWTPGASAYFAYFGAGAGEPGKGWYSYLYGDWLVVALNSNIDTERWSEQVRWLRTVLSEYPARCTLAYFHHPLVSSGAHGDNADALDQTDVRPFWELLYASDAEVVLAGHDHHYERFAPMTPFGTRSPTGIRQFIVGTGGGVLRGPGPSMHPASERFIQDTHGVLKLLLEGNGYRWEFIAADGRVKDSGEGACH